MTERREKGTRRLSLEILGLTAVSALIAVVLFQLLWMCATTAAEVYCVNNALELTQLQRDAMDSWILRMSWIFAAGFFVVLFLILLGDRLRYIRRIISGVDALQAGEQIQVPLEGNNELTRLAESINALSEAQQALQAQEQALNAEKEQLVRTLSHDIRTPLTSIMAYAEFLRTAETRPEQQEQLALILRKAEQIRRLTDILLEGGKRTPERFEDLSLLMTQLAEEVSDALEEQFTLEYTISGCKDRAGTLDVQELHRIFDNLRDNVRKYADPAAPVRLQISAGTEGLVICQENTPAAQQVQEGYGLGISSIRRIAHSYGGRVTIRQTPSQFSITVTLKNI